MTMTRFLLLVLLASFVFACENRMTPARSKRERVSEADENEPKDGDDAKEEAAADDDDGVTPQSQAPVTTPDPVTAPPPAKDPFEGAPAFAGSPPQTESGDHHFGSSNAGKECLSCHAAGKGAPVTFAFAGTIRRSKGNDAPAVGVEVRVVDDKGAEIGIATTDSAGNFWFPGTALIPGGSKVAIRDSAGAQRMAGAIATGACTSGGCHGQSRPIFLSP